MMPLRCRCCFTLSSDSRIRIFLIDTTIFCPSAWSRHRSCVGLSASDATKYSYFQTCSFLFCFSLSSLFSFNSLNLSDDACSNRFYFSLFSFFFHFDATLALYGCFFFCLLLQNRRLRVKELLANITL